MKYLTIILTILLSSCAEKEVHKQHDKLIDWKSEFVMDDGLEADGYYDNYAEFIKPFFSKEYKSDTLKVTTLKQINCCGTTVADIEITKDTIYLKTELISDEACSCIEYDKFTYIIYNPENKKFIIKSEK